jgi:hypothetical protein
MVGYGLLVRPAWGPGHESVRPAPTALDYVARPHPLRPLARLRCRQPLVSPAVVSSSRPSPDEANLVRAELSVVPTPGPIVAVSRHGPTPIRKVAKFRTDLFLAGFWIAGLVAPCLDQAVAAARTHAAPPARPSRIPLPLDVCDHGLTILYFRPPLCSNAISQRWLQQTRPRATRPLSRRIGAVFPQSEGRCVSRIRFPPCSTACPPPRFCAWAGRVSTGCYHGIVRKQGARPCPRNPHT